ncbi:MAG: hypothetical protein M3355_04065 [Actinomycetota bacterium]|nr:hypothetical protein [Actinomycetota bacterium]
MEKVVAREGYELWRPNREKAQSKTTKAIVAFVLLVSAGLIALIVVGGWERMQSSMIAIFSLLWAALYVVFAILIARWNRGLLPVAASLAVIMTIFAAVAAPGWFSRSKDGLDSPLLPEDLVGLLVVVLIPVQILLVIVCLIAFGQEWHVEEERPVGGKPLAGEDDDGYDEGERRSAPPSPSPA